MGKKYSSLSRMRYEAERVYQKFMELLFSEDDDSD
jgi:hypothetical protein